MKIALCLFAVYSFICFSSCTTFNQFDSEAKKGKENEEIFIIKKSGEKLSGSRISQASAMSQADWFKIDGQKVERKDMYAYQNKKAYHIITDGSDIQRLRAGKINLYYYDSYSSGPGRADRGYTSNYVFEKEKGKFVSMNYKNFEDALKDNPGAVKKLQEVFPRNRISNGEKEKLYELIKVVELYND